MGSNIGKLQEHQTPGPYCMFEVFISSGTGNMQLYRPPDVPFRQ